MWSGARQPSGHTRPPMTSSSRPSLPGHGRAWRAIVSASGCGIGVVFSRPTRRCARAAHGPSARRRASPVGRLDREMAQHSTSTAPMALRSLDAPTRAAGGWPAQALLPPPREFLPFARDPAHRRTLREGGRQRERWLVPMPLSRCDSDGPRSVGQAWDAMADTFFWLRLGCVWCHDLPRCAMCLPSTFRYFCACT